MKTKTPELDKILAVKEKSQAIGKFLQWLGEQSLVICEYDHDNSCYDCGNRLCQTRSTIEQLLADFFKIDLNKCEQERQQILADLRSDGR